MRRRFEEDAEEGIKARPTRIPVSGNRDILAVKNIPEGKIGRWVNDVGDRCIKFRQGGWEFVTDKGVTVGEKTVESSTATGSVISRLVGTKANNEPLIAYLMVIDKEWFEEDQARKLDEIDKNEEMIYERLNKRKGSGPMYGNFESNFN